MAVTEVELLVAPEYAAAGLDEAFATLVQMRQRCHQEIKSREAVRADFDQAVIAQMADRAKVRVGSVTVASVPAGVTRWLDRGKLLKKLSAGDVEACMSESPRRWYVRYDDEKAISQADGEA